MGKSWALYQGSSVARAPWLLFVDADTFVDPEAAAITLAHACSENVSAISIVPRLETETFWEYAVMPSVFVTFPIVFGSLAELNNPHKTNRAFLYGVYILISRAAYDAAGGHSAVRGEMVEDMELAALLKRDGRFRSIFVDGRALASVRPYRSLGEIWEGLTKNSFTGAHGSVSTILLGSAGAVAVSLFPLVSAAWALVHHQTFDAIGNILCSLLAIAVTARALRKLGLPLRYAWFQPIGFTVAAAIALTSLANVLSGRGVEWRGRHYTAPLQSVRTLAVSVTFEIKPAHAIAIRLLVFRRPIMAECCREFHGGGQSASHLRSGHPANSV